jgi:hypothetical protein
MINVDLLRSAQAAPSEAAFKNASSFFKSSLRESSRLSFGRDPTDRRATGKSFGSLEARFVYCGTVLRRVLMITVLAIPATARADWLKLEPGEIRFALEPGVSYLHNNGETHWGFAGGGASASFGITDRLALTGFFNREWIPSNTPDLTATAYGFGGKAYLDVLWLTPFIELGLASVYLKPTNGTPYGPTWDVFLGAGVDVRFTRWLFGGIVFRYFAVGGTDVWSNPAYSTINARLGFIFGTPGHSN